MLNRLVLVGRLYEIETSGEEERKVCYIKLSVPRSFKNTDGEYETDIIPIILFGNIATNVNEYCTKGDTIGVKGRIQNNDGIEIIAEKITFLSSKKGE